ncbi:MAG: hypothetical protein IH594_19505, partial [Bacteroidales bacterium]|nr:hypothetical protein [Bacteroidales bacterium]
YECSNDDEIIYHIMNTIRNNEYPTSMEIFYAGHLVKKQTPWKLLSSYLPGIKLLPNIFPFELSWDVFENYFTYLMTD